MRTTFQYRLYPTKAQATAMRSTLDECRWLYNRFLEHRRAAYDKGLQSPSRHEQQATIPELKGIHPGLDAVYSQVLQNVAVRIDLAFNAFHRRTRAGQKPGYPRFRGPGRYDSFCYPQHGFALHQSTVRLSKIGTVRVVLHRPVKGKVKTCCIRRSPTSKWYATFSCEVDPEPLPANEAAVGVDLGLRHFATFSNGETVVNPQFFRSDQKAVTQLHRRADKSEPGSAEHRKAGRAVARVHERIRFRRHNFIHQQSRRIVDRFGFIAIEDLAVNVMVHNHCVAKSIEDAAWSQFARVLTYKAESAGRQIVAVNPAYTSQTCSQCGHRQRLSLADHVYRCRCCLLQIDRDENAAQNILALARQSLASA